MRTRVTFMGKIMENLNPAQQEAVAHMDGPCMVLAGAGSGKTRVLTQRISNLITAGVPHNAILAITFTNKAALEMRERVNRIIPDYSGQWIQTFHAACYRILRAEIEHLGYKRNFIIIDEADARNLVKQILQEKGDYENRPEPVLSLIKKTKNSLTDIEKFYKTLPLPSNLKEEFYQVQQIYQQRLKEFNALDFDDLIMLCIQLFKEVPGILQKYQQKFRYIMIDEYQDTNYAQYVWAKQLAADKRNLFVVGDPDQSVYSWRGAEPYNVNRFLQDYKQVKLIKLEINYRSTRNILNAANAVIKNNEDRPEKVLLTKQDEGSKIVHHCALDSYQEARYIADTIAEEVRNGNHDYSDFAVFYRGHAQSRLLEEALVNKYLPYRIIGARRFYDRKEIADLIAYLRLVVNPDDRLSFRRVINLPKRGIGEKTITRIEEFAEQQGISLIKELEHPDQIPGIGKKIADILSDFFGMITFLGDLNHSGASVREILEQLLNLSAYEEEIRKKNNPDAQTRLDNINELKSLAYEFEQENGLGLDDFLAQIALIQDNDEVDQNSSVTLMTLHGAKGLEFPVVFMTGMEEGIFPSYKAETQEAIEEERRLCYVGITRAEKELYLTNSISRLLYGCERNNPPSRFLKEIPAYLLERSVADTAHSRLATSELKFGDRVLHRKFGVGDVVAVTDDGLITVNFERAGTRLLSLKLAPLEKIE